MCKTIAEPISQARKHPTARKPSNRQDSLADFCTSTKGKV